MGALTSMLVRTFFVWVLAGLVIMFTNLLVISWTSGFEGLPPKLLMNTLLENLPFPFNYTALGYFSPVLLLAHFFIFVLLIFSIEARKRLGEHPLTY